MIMENKIYILQKDLPDISAGAEFKRENNKSNLFAYGPVNKNGNFVYYDYTESFILSKPDWFKLKEEPVLEKTERLFVFHNSVGPNSTERIEVKESDLTQQQKDLLLGELVLKWEYNTSENRNKFFKFIIDKFNV